MTTLLLDGNPFDDLTPLSSLTNLLVLQLGGSNVSDLTPLSGLTGLQTLWLHRTSVSDLTPLSSLTTLNELVLSVNELSDLEPLAGLGGEPVKALLLKRRYGVRYRDAAASLVLARMTDLVAQVLFMALGFALIAGMDLPASFRLGAGGGLAVFSLAIGGAFLVQQRRAFSWLGSRCPLAAERPPLDTPFPVKPSGQRTSFHRSPHHVGTCRGSREATFA